MKLPTLRADTIKREQWILLAIVALGGVLRFRRIGGTPFDFDEQMTIYFCEAPWKVFCRIMWVREMNMVAYYAITHFWLYLGRSEAFVRSLSALFSIAAIPVLYAVAKRLFNENVGLLAAGLLALNEFDIKQAHNARSYALFTLLVTWATLLLVRSLKNPNPKWTLYTIVWVLAVYTHVFAFWFLLAHLVFLLRANIRPTNKQLMVMVSGVLPMVLWTVVHQNDPLTWVPPITAHSVGALFLEFAGNGYLPLSITIIAIVPLLLELARRKQIATELLFVCLLLPITLTVLLSWAQPCFVPRFLGPCIPAMMVLTAAGINGYRRVPAAVLTALILAGFIMGTRSGN